MATASNLPSTGYVDLATETDLSSELASKGGAAAEQSTLKLAGYWTGPVDGEWTPERTDALKKFQNDVGVPATGAVDVAMLSALQQRIARAKDAATTTTVAVTTTSTP